MAFKPVITSSEKSPLLLSGESFPSQVKLIYLADSRPILAKKKFLLEDLEEDAQRTSAA